MEKPRDLKFLLRRRDLLALLLPSALKGQLITPSGYPSLYYPNPIAFGSTGSCTLNEVSANDECVIVFRARASAAGAGLTDIRFRLTTVTTPEPLTIRIETVDAATGYPTGTLAWVDATYELSGAYTAAWYERTLTAAGTGLVAGTYYAIRMYFTSTAGNIVVSLGTNGGIRDESNYILTKDAGGAYVRSPNLTPFAYKLDGTWYAISRSGSLGGVAVATSLTSTARYGNRIISSEYTARVVGIMANGLATSASSGVKAQLYQDGVLLAESAEYDTDMTGIAQYSGFFFEFTSPVIIRRGSQLDLILYRSSGSGTQSLYYYDSIDAAGMAQYEYGTGIYGIQFDGTATWTTHTARRYCVGLVMDAPFAGGGGAVISQ